MVTAAAHPESLRIACELHDVVAHGLSAIAVQAEAAQAALRRDPSAAAATLDAIRLSAHEALDDVRRLIAVTRDDGDTCGRMPQPRLAELAPLVRRAIAGGQPVELAFDGIPRPVAASLELTVYRIVQEALTAAGEHAPGARTTVRIAWAEDALEVEVADDGPGAPRGTAGMHARARLHGGLLLAGASGGGYRVAATFPA